MVMWLESRVSWSSALSSMVFSWTSSAAATRWPRASSTAAAIPVAPADAATGGGGTRSGSSASTTRCASGRKTSSQRRSCATFVFRERASPLDNRHRVDRLGGADQLASGLDLVPDVPEQEAARPPRVVHVGNDALAVRDVPPLYRGEARIDVADRLVAELEHVGVEERQVVVRHARTGHVRADDLAVGLGVVLVLDPEPAAERGRREARDVAGREDVLVALDPSELVDDDAVVDGDPRRLGELRRRLDAEPGDDDVRLERAARSRRDLAA